MSNLSPARLFVQTESVLTREPVGESMLQTGFASVNFLLTSTILYHEWTMNGPIKTFNGQTFVDGIKEMQADWPAWAITGAAMYGSVQGNSGTVELDIKIASFGSTSWASIFSTTPKITSSAAAGVTVYNGDTVAGCTAPVLTASPLSVTAKDKLRMDVIQMQGGSPRNFGIRVFYRGA